MSVLLFARPASSAAATTSYVAVGGRWRRDEQRFPARGRAPPRNRREHAVFRPAVPTKSSAALRPSSRKTDTMNAKLRHSWILATALLCVAPILTAQEQPDAPKQVAAVGNDRIQDRRELRQDRRELRHDRRELRRDRRELRRDRRHHRWDHRLGLDA
jgi:hypothetical protein